MRKRLSAVAAAVAALLAVALVDGSAANARPTVGLGSHQGLSGHQRAVLRQIARDTWRFFQKDVDPNTHLPLDNLGPSSTRGNYTSSANVGVYLWSVVAAHDLHLINRREADARVSATLHEVEHLQRGHGFLYQWYDTTTGHVILNPGQGDCPKVGGTTDNCSFLSAVDNGWYASGLVVVRQALPDVRALATKLLNQTDFSIFYDNRPQTDCNVNANIDNQPTGQMYGGYYEGVGPAGYHNGALYSDPRIAMYIGMGLHQMPGDVWWRTWRVLPPKRCDSDPDFSWQGQPQGPGTGYWTTIVDPLSGKTFPVWEGHYTYPGTSLKFLPTYAGGMFEGLMANEVVPETTWGRQNFGLADHRTARVQIKYATQALHYPVWGISPSSTPDDTGGYNAYGAGGAVFPNGERLAQCNACAPENAVTPHASFLALDVTPQRAYANIQRLRRLYPDIYTRDGGFYDAVDPVTGSVGHRRLVLDQSMIMAALDNALNGRRMQRWFAADPVSFAARLVLAVERMSLR
jgi:hypothetical protein